jgi:ubiquinone/menaquinone biosynthesis C-methylase UbiE
LKYLSDACDPISQDRLRTLPIQEGWQCLDVGTGLGTIALFLAERVGATGQVLAIDLDPQFAPVNQHPRLRVARVDITRDEFP